MPWDDDASLLTAIARDRDGAAFEAFYDRHHRLAFGLACRMLGDAGEAEDLLQAVFLRIWERADSYDPGRASAAAWVCVMVRSRCLDRLRQRGRRRRRELPAEQAVLEALAPAAPPAADPTHGRALALALEELPALQRAAVETIYFGGLTQVEAARDLRLPLGTLKGRLRLAMDKLAQALAKGGQAS